MFFDEFGYSFLDPLGHTWAPRGHPPILRRVTSQRREVSTAVGLTLSGHIYKCHFEHSIHGPDIITALQHLQRHVPGRIVLVWDRSPTHKACVVSESLASQPDLYVEWLPGYAPEINPEEYCHGNAKKHLKNATPADKRQVRQMLDREFARIRRRPDLIPGFFHRAGLTVRRLW